MCNHAVSLANEGFDVDLVGFAGSGTMLKMFWWPIFVFGIL